MSRPGTKVCVHALRREHVEAARAVLARHPAVLPESVSHDGDRLRFDLELSRLPDGDGPEVEAVIVTEIEREARR